MPGLSSDAVLDLLREVAAEVITPRFRSLTAGEVMEKNPGDLVTVADREAEVLITTRLNDAYPDAVVLGEEAYATDHSLMDRYLAAEHAFTVDPVDGTKNFVHGSPDHAVMVAERGAGTWRDDEQVRVTPVPPDSQPRGVTSMWCMRDHALDGMPPMRLSWVCCGVDYPRLIEGATDYILYSRSNPWDHAPGSLMVAEAGGTVGHPDGTPYGPRSLTPGIVVAVDRPTYAAVRRRVAPTFAR